MSIFDGIKTAEQAMSVHRFRSEIAGENLANVYTPGYQRQVVELQANSFNDAMSRASGSGTDVAAAGSAASTDSVDGAVLIAGVHTVASGANNQRKQALEGVIDMMAAKGAFELNQKVVTMLKSMALSSLEIGRGA